MSKFPLFYLYQGSFDPGIISFRGPRPNWIFIFLSYVCFRSVLGQYQVGLRSVSGQSQVFLKYLCAYFVKQMEPKKLRLVISAGVLHFNFLSRWCIISCILSHGAEHSWGPDLALYQNKLWVTRPPLASDWSQHLMLASDWLTLTKVWSPWHHDIRVSPSLLCVCVSGDTDQRLTPPNTCIDVFLPPTSNKSNIMMVLKIIVGNTTLAFNVDFSIRVGVMSRVFPSCCDQWSEAVPCLTSYSSDPNIKHDTTWW